MAQSVAFRQVCVTLKGGHGLRGLTFVCAEGEWVTLFGPAAAGKTLALRVAAGEVVPSSGAAEVLGAAAGTRRRGVAHIIDARAPITGRTTVRGRVLRGLARAGVPAFQRAARTSEVLEALGLAERAEVIESDLSGCERSALAVAAALASHPRVVLLDGILGQLTPDLAQRITCYLDARRATDGWCVLHATTSAADAARADRVVMLDEGQALAIEDPQVLIDRWALDRVAIEADDPSAVRRTLTGLFDLVVEQTETSLTIHATDAVATAAQVFRHPDGGVRVVHVVRGDLWHAHAQLRASQQSQEGPSVSRSRG